MSSKGHFTSLYFISQPDDDCKHSNATTPKRAEGQLDFNQGEQTAAEPPLIPLMYTSVSNVWNTRAESPSAGLLMPWMLSPKTAPFSVIYSHKITILMHESPICSEIFIFVRTSAAPNAFHFINFVIQRLWSLESLRALLVRASTVAMRLNKTCLEWNSFSFSLQVGAVLKASNTRTGHSSDSYVDGGASLGLRLMYLPQLISIGCFSDQQTQTFNWKMQAILAEQMVHTRMHWPPRNG